MEVKLPEGMTCSGQPYPAAIGNREQIKGLIANCQDVLEENGWRRWDVVQAGQVLLMYLGVDISQPWIELSVGTPTVHLESWVGSVNFLFNLVEILAQGPVVVGFQEQEIERLTTSCYAKLDAALTDYRWEKNRRPPVLSSC